MRLPAPRIALAALAVLCASAASYGALASRAADAPRAAAEIRVRMRPGAHYARTEGDSVGILKLLRCTPAGRPERGRAVASRGRSAIARNAVGDQLEIPAGAGPEGMSVGIERRPGNAFRSVDATADAAVNRAILTIDARGCEGADGIRIVLWSGGNQWDDVGGTMNGTAVTADLAHLSIYALAGN